MGITLRSSKPLNTPLTWTETDDNFSYLLTNVSGSNVKIVGATVLTGSLVVSGSTTSVTVAGTASLQHVIPFSNGTYSLGTSGAQWSNVYATTFNGTAFSGSLNGTSSWATNALTASQATNALTASNITPAITSYTVDGVMTSNGDGTLSAESSFTFDGDTVIMDAASLQHGSSTLAFNVAHAEGANTTASGYYSHAEGSYTISSGQSSHAEGTYTTSSGVASHAEGASTLASGIGAHAEGTGSKATGNYSHTDGYYTIATASGSYAGGAYASSSHAYEWSRSDTSLGQYGTITLSAQTTNSTPTQLSIGGTGVDYFTIPTNTAYYVDLTIMAFNPNTNTRTWNGRTSIYNNGGTVAIDGTGFALSIITGSLSGGTINVSAAADNTNDRLAISVTGSVGTDIRWFAKADYIKISS
jgi:hypothetical protein